jgi:hypothetical protein
VVPQINQPAREFFVTGDAIRLGNHQKLMLVSIPT